MSNISNLFEMSSSTSVWNQRSPLIQSHCFMNTCTECSGCSQIRQMVVFWLPSILFHFPGWFQSRKSYLYCIVNKVVGSQPKVWMGGTRQIKVDIIYRKLFKDGLTSILPHSAFRMGISQVCKVFSFACWSFAAFKAHLRRFRACWHDKMGDIHLLGSNLRVLWLCLTYTVRFESIVLFIHILSTHNLLFLNIFLTPPPTPFAQMRGRKSPNWGKGEKQLHSRTQWTYARIVNEKERVHVLEIPIMCTILHFQWTFLPQSAMEGKFPPYRPFVLPTLYKRGAGNLTI